MQNAESLQLPRDLERMCILEEAIRRKAKRMPLGLASRAAFAAAPTGTILHPASPPLLPPLERAWGRAQPLLPACTCGKRNVFFSLSPNN